MTELCDLSALELRRLIGAKQISPVELLASCRARIERVNGAVNAFVATCWERAEAEARAAEQAVMAGEALGPLHGLPIGIKDLALTEGLRTTFGSPQFADFVPEADERQVAAVRRAGAIVVGKTNTPEFGAGANTVNPVYGATGNPFDPDKTCAGSSGGSAVALATGMVPLATGSDMGGSLRNPAAYCGVVGFRPSPGAVPHELRLVGWSPLGVQGPMGRTVADAALLFGVMAGTDPRDPLVLAAGVRAASARAGRSRQPARRDQRGSRLRPGRRSHPRECSAMRSPASAACSLAPTTATRRWTTAPTRRSRSPARSTSSPGTPRPGAAGRTCSAPTSAANVEQGLAHEPRGRRARDEDAHAAVSALPRIHGRLRRAALPGDGGAAVSAPPALRRGDQRPAPAHLLPLAGASLRPDAHRASGRVHPVRARSHRHAVRHPGVRQTLSATGARSPSRRRSSAISRASRNSPARYRISHC